MQTESLAEALDPFIEDGLLADVLYPIKSGKEATVYCCSARPRVKADFVAAKVYKPRTHRSFHDDSVYREGRVILNQHDKRAAAKKTDLGGQVQSALWQNHEWEVLKVLQAAGADVPKPLAHSSGGMLLEFIGDADGAAPMLKEAHLSHSEPQEMFERLLDNVQLWLAYNIVHGDLSAYNVLYRAGTRGHRFPAGVRSSGQHQRVSAAAARHRKPGPLLRPLRRDVRRFRPGGALLGRLGTAVGHGHFRQAVGALGVKLVGLESPRPVRFERSRRVHAGLATQVEHVLEWHDRGVGDRAQRGAHQVLGDVRAVCAEVARGMLAFVL